MTDPIRTVAWATRRRMLAAVPALAAIGPWSGARAQAYPNRPLTFVVPVTPGGPSDLMTRAVAARLGPRLGTTVVVENRTGAAGLVGLRSVLQAKPDGYTFVMAGANVLASVPHLDPAVGYEVERDIELVSLTARMPLVLYMTPTIPATTLAEFVAYGKANPGKLSFASAGQASTAHLCAELLCALTGLDMTHVPYRGSAAAITDLTPGRVHILFDASSTMTHVQSGALKALAVNTPQRLAAFPTLPTFAESGYADFPVQLWFALVGPKGIPKPSVDTLNAALREVLQDPELVATFAKQGVELLWSTPQDLARFQVEQSAKMKALITSRRITADK